MKAAIYCRVSTDEQTTANQILALNKLAIARGYEIVQVYTESETAWKRGHQAELERCKQDAFNRVFDVILVWSLDRLSRLGVSAMFRICENFWNLGIKVVSLQEPQIEVEGYGREIMLFFAGLFAKMDSDRKSERTRAGLARRKAEGFTLGKPPGSKDKRKRARRADIGKPHRFNKVLKKSDKEIDVNSIV
jgi:putative DNA-invertase from lambdoid prophage Rac